MTQTLFAILAILIGYVLGSVPFGLLIVRITTGKDIRQVASGRTGGTNAMRAAGFWAGLLTAILDILKGAGAVWIAKALVPDQHWVHIFAPLGTIIGHNYSIFLPNYDDHGKFAGLRGGAGGAPAAGGAMGLWVTSIAIIFPLALLVFFTFGYASITTICIALFAIIIFAIRALHGFPWQDIVYGVIAELLLIWALRPNIKSLLEGNERVVSISLNGKLKARREAAKPRQPKQ